MIKTSLKEAHESFKEGSALISKGIKLVTAQALEGAKQLPNKASMVFNSLRKHLSGETKPEHHNSKHTHHTKGHKHSQ